LPPVLFLREVARAGTWHASSPIQFSELPALLCGYEPSAPCSLISKPRCENFWHHGNYRTDTPQVHNTESTYKIHLVRDDATINTLHSAAMYVHQRSGLNLTLAR